MENCTNNLGTFLVKVNDTFSIKRKTAKNDILLEMIVTAF